MYGGFFQILSGTSLLKQNLKILYCKIQNVPEKVGREKTDEYGTIFKCIVI